MSTVTKNETAFNWRIFYIVLPLLPFLIGGVLKYISIASTCNEAFEAKDYVILLFSTWDTLKFAFATSIMPFFVKKDLLETKILLPNKDKEEEVRKTCSILFLYGLLGFIFFGVLLILKTLHFDCSIATLSTLYQVITVCVYLLGLFTILTSINIQESYKLEAKSII